MLKKIDKILKAGSLYKVIRILHNKPRTDKEEKTHNVSRLVRR